MKSTESLYLGIDIGGTKVAAGLVTSRGEILSKVRMPMPSREDAAAGLRAVEKAIDAAFAAEPARKPPSLASESSAPGPLIPCLASSSIPETFLAGGIIRSSPKSRNRADFRRFWIMTRMRRRLRKPAGAPVPDTPQFFT